MTDLAALHKAEHGTEPEVIASAPGKIHLIGDHTEYNDGFVLPVAIDRYVHIAMSRRKDSSLRFFAADLGERKRTTIPNLKYRREDRWANLTKSVIAALLKLGFSMKGVNVTVSGTIPQKIGLASSAAVQIASIVALDALFDLSVNNVQAIQAARRADTTFLERPPSIAEKLVCYLAREGTAMILDVRNVEYRYIPLDLGSARLLVTDSRVPTSSSQAEIQSRKRDCEHCVTVLKTQGNGSSLRDFDAGDLRQSMGLIPEGPRRRCLHVVEENRRVQETEEALRAADLVAAGKLMSRSHESLRDLFEVSCPELDWLVKRAWETDGVYGSRMTGLGFGGCTITLIEERAVNEYLERLEEYERIFGFQATAFLVQPSGGARVTYP
jgi:galactokinase